MSTSPTAVGSNIRAELARRSLSQRDLAAALGISQSQLSKRLRGQIDLSVAELTAAAAYLDVPIGSLLPEPQPAAS